MARAVADLLREMRANSQGVRFSDAMRVAEHFFGEPRKSGTSHRVFKTGWPGDPRVNLQEGKNGEAKAYQERQLVRAVDHLEGLQGKDRNG